MKRPLAAQTPTSKTIFLADTSPDLSLIHSEIRSELLAYGYRVLPEEPLPTTLEAFSDTVRELLAECRLSVHLVGRETSETLADDSRPGVALLNELAVEASHKTGLSRLIWLPVAAESDDDRHQAFLEFIRNDPQAQFGAELFETPIEELKFGIHDRLKTDVRQEPHAAQAHPMMRKAGTSAHKNAKTQAKRIYLICDRRDLDQTLKLEDFLADSGFEVLLPSDGDPAAVRTAHIEALCICDAAIIYFGTPGEQWVRTKIRDIQKITGYGRLKPIMHRGIYVAQPPTNAKKSFDPEDLAVFNGLDGFSPAIMAAFLDVIQAAI